MAPSQIGEAVTLMSRTAQTPQAVSFTEFARGSSWKKSFAERGFVEVKGRDSLDGYYVSPELAGEMARRLEELEEALAEAVDTGALTRRAAAEPSWSSGDEAYAQALEALGNLR